MSMLRAALGNAVLMTALFFLAIPYLGPIWLWALRGVLETLQRL